MKALLFKTGNDYQLLVDGLYIRVIDEHEAKSFIVNYDNPAYYDVSKETVEVALIKNDLINNNAIVGVDDEMKLIVYKPKVFRDLIATDVTYHLTSAEYSKLHGRQQTIIIRMCRNGRIPGAVQKGNLWLIPMDAEYPSDKRFRTESALQKNN